MGARPTVGVVEGTAGARRGSNKTQTRAPDFRRARSEKGGKLPRRFRPPHPPKCPHARVKQGVSGMRFSSDGSILIFLVKPKLNPLGKSFWRLGCLLEEVNPCHLDQCPLPVPLTGGVLSVSLFW